MKQRVLMGPIHCTDFTDEAWVCLNNHVGTLYTIYWSADNPGLPHEESDASSENNHEDDFSGSDDFLGFYDY
jgi:hypothetical protein